jgi:hypothetical protein
MRLPNTEASPCGLASLPAHQGAGGVSSTRIQAKPGMSTGSFWSDDWQSSMFMSMASICTTALSSGRRTSGWIWEASGDFAANRYGSGYPLLHSAGQFQPYNPTSAHDQGYTYRRSRLIICSSSRAPSASSRNFTKDKGWGEDMSTEGIASYAGCP